MDVLVRVKVHRKTISEHWTADEKGVKPNQTIIDMSVVSTADKNHPNYLYSQLSGGTNFQLATINQEAADQFKLGGEYECVFTPVQK